MACDVGIGGEEREGSAEVGKAEVEGVVVDRFGGRFKSFEEDLNFGKVA